MSKYDFNKLLCNTSGGLLLHRIETDQLICSANQLTGFNMQATLAFNELILQNLFRCYSNSTSTNRNKYKANINNLLDIILKISQLEKVTTFNNEKKLAVYNRNEM